MDNIAISAESSATYSKYAWKNEKMSETTSGLGGSWAKNFIEEPITLKE